MKAILKLNHWQIFLLIYGIPLLALLLPSSRTTTFPFNALCAIAYIYVMIAQISYPIIIGKALHKRLPSTITLSNKLIPLFFSCFCVLIVIMSISTWIEPQLLRDYPPVFMLMILLSLIFIFFVARFAAKVIASTELKRAAKPIEYLGYLIGLWLIFMGVWFVQPKIRNLITQGDVAP